MVAQRLREDFHVPVDAPLLLVMRGLPAGLSDDSARTVLRQLLAPLENSGVVHSLLSPATSLDTVFWSSDRRSALALVETKGEPRTALRTLRARSSQLVSAARVGRSGDALRTLTMRWTGEPALLEDLKDLAARELRRSEWRALPITLLAAWWAFGTLIEAAVATAVAALVVVTALGIVGGLSVWWPASPLTASLVSLTGLALSVDYQLIVRRARDSGNTAGEAKRLVRWAALLVSTAFALLALLPTGDVRSAAFAGAITSMLAAVAASVRNRVADPSHVPGLANAVPDDVPFADRGRWRAWSVHVTRHAWPVLFAATAVVVWLAWPMTRLRLASPVETLLPHSAESMQALDDLTAFGRASVPLTLTVLADLAGDASVFDERGWSSTRQAVNAVRALPAVARVDAITTIGTGERVVAQYVLPEAVQSTMVSRTRHTVRLIVWPTEASVDAVQRLAGGIRATLQRDTGVASVVVGGLPVLVQDVADRVMHTLPLVVIGTMLMSAFMLTWRFRAPLIAIKAVVVNGAVAAAAMGVVVRVFQDGTGASILGTTTYVGIFPTVPLLVFAATFGISMDYELVLLTAVERASRTGAETAIATAMADVGGLIWRAAALTGAVCGAFALSALASLAMIGVALCSAVLLDATLVRLMLVPAWLTVASQWNWWPHHRPGRRGPAG